MKISKHRILITGSGGFVGTWLRRELASRSEEESVKVITAGRSSECDYVVDIINADQVRDVLRQSQPTAVIHLAAIAAPNQARQVPRLAWDVNFNGTMNLAYAVLAETPDARFVFAGSSEAYGASFSDSGGLPLDENASLRPMGIYGATKAAADIMVGQLGYEGLKATRFRPFNHSGPEQTADYVVSAFASQIAEIGAGKRDSVIKVGNLSAYRDFLDVRDVVRAYADAALLSGDQIDGKVFNLSTGHATQICDLLNQLIEISGAVVNVQVDPDRMRPPEIDTAAGNNAAVASALGWAPKIPLDQTLRDVLSYWSARSNGSGAG